MVTASAPGKAVLSGEYAVLGAAPALSMALNRRATATIRAIEGDCHRVSAPGFLDGEFRFRVSPDGRFDWQFPPPATCAFELLEAVWRQVPAACHPHRRLYRHRPAYR